MKLKVPPLTLMVPGMVPGLEGSMPVENLIRLLTPSFIGVAVSAPLPVVAVLPGKLLCRQELKLVSSVIDVVSVLLRLLDALPSLACTSSVALVAVAGAV